VSSHEQSVRLFKQVGVDTPSIERYIANGLDLIYLTSAFEQIEDEGLEPEFVFYPVMPLWPKINNLISSNLLIVNNKTAPDGDVRLLAIEDVWQYDRQIFQQEKASVVNNPNAHYVEKDGSIWVASVISGTKHSQYLNQTLQESLNLIQIKDPRSNHAGLSQLVTLIALSLQAGKSSIGMVACTWTGQTFTDNEGNARAVCASCDLGHDVFVDSTGIDFRDYLIGARRSAIG
jgi:hypothetical protein